MSEQKYLGKISKVNLGLGGYQDAMLGLTLGFTFEGSSIADFINAGWIGPRPKHAKWSEVDRDKLRAKFVEHLETLLAEAKINDVTKLLDKPVELVIEDSGLKSWRILKEVL